MLEGRVAALDMELDVDMESQTSDSRTVNKELMKLLITVDNIQAKTPAIRNSKKGLSEQIVRVRDMNEGKLEKAEE